METVAPFKEIIDAIKAAGGDAFKRCYQCGLCDTVCPWNRVTQFSMRKVVREATFGLTEIESEDIWRCTTCGRCPQRCPRDVQQIASGVALRRIATEYGVFPAAVQPIKMISASLSGEGNPLNEERKKRAAWTKGLDVKTFTEGTEVLFFPCCYQAYDPRSQKVGRAIVEILNAAGVDFGTLGEEESCCGESIRKAGDETLFKRLARQNIRTWVEHGVKTILVSSPHCYHTFRNEYPELGGRFEVKHVSQFIGELMREGRLTLSKDVAKTITYHDPCYLGRHNGVYDDPREALKQVPGVALTEMPEARRDSFCCGGGGGRIWMETPKEERFSDVRLEQAVGTGAEMLVTSCPYCITNFEDSRLNRPDGGASIEIRDITEVIREAL